MMYDVEGQTPAPALTTAAVPRRQYVAAAARAVLLSWKESGGGCPGHGRAGSGMATSETAP